MGMNHIKRNVGMISPAAKEPIKLAGLSTADNANPEIVERARPAATHKKILMYIVFGLTRG
jgi:hypothetical protein